MAKINLCDTCLHRVVCRHGIAQQWGRMARCKHYERLIRLVGTSAWIRRTTPPEENEA